MTTPLTSTPPSALDQQRYRIEVVEDTLATMRMEGLEPTPELQQAFARYIAGEISVEQIYRDVHSRNRNK